MLAGVCCFFNPMKYKRPLENWHRFKEELRDDLPLYSIELSFDGEFQTDSTWRIRGNIQDHLMWQKERLLNLAIERVPKQYDAIAWLDCDILFLNERWVEETEEVLDEKPIAQLFDTVVMLDERFRPTRRNWGIGSALFNQLDANRGHPGYAWAARREVLPLLDDHILGCGDVLMAYAWLGQWEGWLRTMMNESWYREYLKWAVPQYEKIQGNVGYVSGDVFHLWHGTWANRKYCGKWKYLTSYDYKPCCDIKLDSNGLWTWASDKTDMHASVRHHFKERREDGL
jgi:hypothetical protein